MAANVAYRNFSSGELSPAFHAATDRAAYARGLRTLPDPVTVSPEVRDA